MRSEVEQKQPFERVNVAGVPFQVTSLTSAAEWLTESVVKADFQPVSVRLANVYCVALTSNEPSYRQLMSTRGINFPDGLPVVGVMKAMRRGQTKPERVRGPSFFREVLHTGVSQEVRHFFVGSTPAVLDELQRRIREQVPDIKVSGTYSPPFEDLSDDYLDEIVSRASAWEADIVWVGMGTPKQDYVAQAIADRANITAIGVGAAFDYVAGSVREAPEWIQRSGLEWAYRLAVEPRRLWQRYFFGNLTFGRLIASQFVQYALRARQRRLS
jgi:N-acetylglucosaminyldiphosphoundecaprenol N-acetyl-beta-D-mannosaminyltransferase